MDITRVVLSFILFSLAIGSFTISFFQFKERGYLFNNAYIWANREKRKRLNENKEDKTTYYRQSGFSFMFIGIIFLIFAIYIFTHWIWMLVALVHHNCRCLCSYIIY